MDGMTTDLSSTAERLRLIAERLDEVFNGSPVQERVTGFVLLAFPVGGDVGVCNYVSNGVDRKDMVALFREMAARLEGQACVRGRA